MNLDLVVFYLYFKEEKYNQLFIGGVDSKEWGTISIACVMYHLPGMVQRHQFNITIVILETVLYNTISGRPLQIKLVIVDSTE